MTGKPPQEQFFVIRIMALRDHASMPRMHALPLAHNRSDPINKIAEGVDYLGPGSTGRFPPEPGPDLDQGLSHDRNTGDV